VLSASEAKKRINAFGVGRSFVRFFDALADGCLIISDVRLEVVMVNCVPENRKVVVGNSPRGVMEVLVRVMYFCFVFFNLCRYL
jgi:hypothetical protein